MTLGSDAPLGLVERIRLSAISYLYIYIYIYCPMLYINITNACNIVCIYNEQCDMIHWVCPKIRKAKDAPRLLAIVMGKMLF